MRSNKFYFKKDNTFHILKKKSVRGFLQDVDLTYSFDDFCKVLKNNMDNVDLVDFDLEKYNYKNLKLDKAFLSSKMQDILGLYNHSFSDNFRHDTKQLISNINDERTASLELIKDNNEIQNVYFGFYSRTCQVISYISDLHLDFKIAKKFPSKMNEYELENFLCDVVRELYHSIFGLRGHPIIVFTGDITFNPYVLEKFFKIYREKILFDTIFILGNHELWNGNPNEDKNRKEDLRVVFNNYKKTLKKYDVHLLQNEIFIPNSQEHIYGENWIIGKSKAEIREVFNNNSFAILGGIGFSGLNKEFNCDSGIYRGAIKDRSEEIELSKRFLTIYEKLADCCYDKTIIVATHMPVSDWNEKPLIANWIYINGHTHKNNYIELNGARVFADNQVGYQKDAYQFKCFDVDSSYNIFEDFDDGIYEITRVQYIAFYRGQGFSIEFNPKDMQSIYLIKKDKCYLFTYKDNNNKLFLLSGGSKRIVSHQNNEYFFNNMDKMQDSISRSLESFNKYLNQISKEVKSFGGTGTVHGCIVDINFFCHVYANPIDNGKLTSYYATSIIDKYVYKNIQSLVHEKVPSLFAKLTMSSNGSGSLLLPKECGKEITIENTYVPSTEIYRVSKIIKNLQYSTNNNIIRFWDDSLINDVSSDGIKLLGYFVSDK